MILPLDGRWEGRVIHNIENKLSAIFCKLKLLFSGIQDQKDFKLYVVCNKSRYAALCSLLLPSNQEQNRQT